jgi:hypothetical protein
MNSHKFPWHQLFFSFIFALLLGFIYLPLESRSLPWFVWIIILPFAALIYAITESIFTALLKDLEFFLGKFWAFIVFFLVGGSGMGVGYFLANLLTAFIKSHTKV